MKINNVAAIAVLSVVISGCASIVSGSSESVAISTTPTVRATCTLTNPRGTWRLTTPGRVRVKRSKEDMDVICKAPGYADATGTISSDFEMWTLGNVLFGGLIDLGVDWATGAVNEYEHRFQIPMEAAPGGFVPPPTRVPVPVPNS